MIVKHSPGWDAYKAYAAGWRRGAGFRPLTDPEKTNPHMVRGYDAGHKAALDALEAERKLQSVTKREIAQAVLR